MEKIVIALGGNALLEEGGKRTYEAQYLRARSTFASLASILKNNMVVITHGNGQQVGDIILSHELSRIEAPVHQCVAMSQGSIAEILANAYNDVSQKLRIKKEIIALLTRVAVDASDPAFKNPTKPVGRSYTASEAVALGKKGWAMKKTDNGWRRVVPSPIPKEIIDIKAIESSISEDTIPIAAGGGGIPVIRKGKKLVGVDAVIDKDLSSSLLATSIGASVLMILTNVPYVYLNYEKAGQKAIKEAGLEEMQRYLEQGQFEEGSMKPKVEAAIEFVRNGGKRAIITSLDKAPQAFAGRFGTIIG